MNEFVQRELESLQEARKQEKLMCKAKHKAAEDLANELMQVYSDKIIDMDEVYALGIDTWHAYEDTGVKIEITIEPAVQDEEVENWVEWKDSLENKINNIIEEDISIKIDLDFGDEIRWNK